MIEFIPEKAPRMEAVDTREPRNRVFGGCPTESGCALAAAQRLVQRAVEATACRTLAIMASTSKWAFWLSTNELSKCWALCGRMRSEQFGVWAGHINVRCTGRAAKRLIQSLNIALFQRSLLATESHGLHLHSRCCENSLLKIPVYTHEW